MDRIVQIIKVLIVMVLVVLVIFKAQEFAAQNSTPEKIKPVEIKDELYELECGTGGKVIKAVIDVKISGGIRPYQFEFDQSDPAYSNVPGSGIRVTLEGGQRLILKVTSATSDGEPMDVYDVYAPLHHPDCDVPLYTPTYTPTPTSTPTPTPTYTPTRTKRITFTPTPTKDGGQGPHSPTGTPTGTSSNPHPGNATNTPTDEPLDPTNTPIIDPTGTPVKLTSTPTPKVSTSTPTRQISTPTTAPTPTPTTHPSLAECEDGRDNDGDGRIDLQDGQCQRGSDNHEDR